MFLFDEIPPDISSLIQTQRHDSEGKEMAGAILWTGLHDKVSFWKPGHFLCFDKKKVLLELFVELVWSDAIELIIVTYIVVSSATTNIVSLLLYCYFFLYQQYTIRTNPITVSFSAFTFQWERYGGRIS